MTENSFIDRREELLSNLNNVKANIATAAAAAGRDASDITIMAVTKTQPAEDINTLIEAGLSVYGENRVQELMQKQPLLLPCDAHFIGRLQKNKVKYLVDTVSMIESVDSAELLDEIDRRCQKKGRNMNVLFEINIGREEQKGGIFPEEVDKMLTLASEKKHIFVKGFMTVPPICEEKAEILEYFSKMSRLFIDNRDKKTDNINISVLSMGMSHDYTDAIAFGSTQVRVGTGLFGTRVYR